MTTQRNPYFFSSHARSTHGARKQSASPRFGESADELSCLYANSLEAQTRLAPHADALRLPGLPGQIKGSVTPLQASRKIPAFYYKREDLTVTRAYKVRGAVVAMSRAMDAEKNDFVTVSTGNHAMGILKAAEILHPRSVQLVIPENVLPAKQEKLLKKIEFLKARGISARLVLYGENFEKARSRAKGIDGHYIDPYLDLDVISGQGTVGLELASQVLPLLQASPHVKNLDVIVPVGGGGLLTGVANSFLSSLQHHEMDFSDLNVRLVGLRLSNMASPFGDAIRVRKLEEQSLHRLKHLGVSLREVKDLEIQKGLDFVQSDLNAHVEGAAAAAVSPVLVQEDCLPHPSKLIVSVISGGNVAEND